MLIDVDEVIKLYVDCLEDIYKLHSPKHPKGGPAVCLECAFSWPCRTARMVASVR
jgi:hypothetical protein